MNDIRYQANRQKIGSLDCVVVAPEDSSTRIRALAVFCHGFGAGGDDLVGLAGELLQCMTSNQPVGMIFPAAPLSLESEGMPGSRAWWMLSIQRLLSAMEDGRYEQIRDEVPEGIELAQQALVDVINSALEHYNLPASQLLLGGFSQGAMLSVETACLGLTQPPGQLCLYSGALICERRWSAAMPKLKDTTILQSHGRLDPILPLQTGLWLKEKLIDAGCEVEFIEFNGPHTIPSDSIMRTGQMLAQLAERLVAPE